MITLFVFPLIGYFIFSKFTEENWFYFLDSGLQLYYQVPIGITYGWITAVIAWRIISHRQLKPAMEKYKKIIYQLNLRPADVLFISFCAGFGEELLFRVSLQPLLGIFFTSVLFVALHGYLNPRDWRISIYGSFMTLVIIGMGWLYLKTGFFTAAISHTVIDIYLLQRIRKV